MAEYMRMDETIAMVNVTNHSYVISHQTNIITGPLCEQFGVDFLYFINYKNENSLSKIS